jgi:hypothetical protein
MPVPVPRSPESPLPGGTRGIPVILGLQPTRDHPIDSPPNSIAATMT